MSNPIKFILIVAIGIVLSLIPSPQGLSQGAWIFFSLFVCVFLGLIFEPLPSPYIAFSGIVLACILKVGPQVEAGADITSAEAIRWGLSGFSNTTVWLIFIAFMFAMGYEKSGLGKRIALLLVSKMGKRTIGLGYAIALADLVLAPFMPSNTARSGGTIFPIVENIPLLYGSTPEKDPRKIGSYLVWVALAATCVTSSMFYTGLATNVLAKSLTEDLGITAPTWNQWFLCFLPVGIILFISVPILTYWVYPPDLRSSEKIPRWAKDELAKMGGISNHEKMMTALVCLALVLWILGSTLEIHVTVSALLVLCLMVLCGIISWNDILTNKAAWNVLIWFGSIVALAGGLKNVGFLDWFANRITSGMAGYSPSLILILLLLSFYFIHYLFASSTAHVTALLTIFLTTGMNIPGMDFNLYIYVLLYSLGLMGILTPYATGPSPIWYGLGYIPSKTFWMLGAFFGIIFIAALIVVGIPWIKLWI